MKKLTEEEKAKEKEDFVKWAGSIILNPCDPNFEELYLNLVEMLRRQHNKEKE